jgi:hypothetical protein
MELHNFALKDDGIVYLVENMPEKPKYGKWHYQDSENMRKDLAYGEALQSAIDSANVEVSNYNEVWLKIIEHERRNNSFEWTPEVNTPYSLLCSVEDDPFWLLEVNQFGEQSRFHKVFVTFPESGEKKEPCPNCKELVAECACLRNKCNNCGEPVGNITFPVCDDCWDAYHKAEPEKKEQEETQEQLDEQEEIWEEIITDIMNGDDCSKEELIIHYIKTFIITRK